jgi:FG-GAP-like repeat
MRSLHFVSVLVILASGMSAASWRVDVYLGNGDGTFGMPIRAVVPGDGSPTSGGGLFVADCNADGKPDVAITLNSGDGFDPPYGYILLSNGDGTFTQGLGASVWLRLQLAI